MLMLPYSYFCITIETLNQILFPLRSGILSGMAGLTALLCIVKLARLHIAQHPSYHQYIIFYAATLECITGYGSIINLLFFNILKLALSIK